MNTTSPIHLRRPLVIAVVTALLLAVLALAASTTEAQDQPSATITLEDTELVLYENADNNTSRPSTGHFVDNTRFEETYTIQLDSAPTGNVTVAISIDKTYAAHVSPESLIFTASNWSTPQTVTVESDSTDDTFPVHPETLTISHTATGGGYDGAAIPDVEVLRYDADNIVYYEFKELQYTVQEGGTYQFTLVQTSKDDIPWFFTTHVTVQTPAGTAGASDRQYYQAETGFPWWEAKRVADGAGGHVWRAEKTWTLQTYQDQRLEGDEYFRVVLERSASLDHMHLILDGTSGRPDRDTMRIDIVDDEPPPGLEINGAEARVRAVGAVTAFEGDEGTPGTAGAYTVNLTSQPPQYITELTLNLWTPSAWLNRDRGDEPAPDVLAPARVTVSPETLTFNRRNWNTPQTVTVTAAPDDDALDESVIITNRFDAWSGFDGVLVEALVEDDEAAADAGPGRPQGLEVRTASTAYGTPYLYVAWSYPSDDGGSRVTSYVVQRKWFVPNTWRDVATVRLGGGNRSGAFGLPKEAPGGSGPGHSYQDDYGVLVGQAYRHRVAAVNRIGQGPWATTGQLKVKPGTVTADEEMMVGVAALYARLSEGRQDIKFGLSRQFFLAEDPLTVRLRVSESGGDRMAARHEGERTVTFPVGSHWIALDLPMRDNEYHEPDGEVRVEVLPGDGYQVRPGGGSDWTDILEDPRDHGEYELSVFTDGGPVHEGRPAAFEVCRQSYFGFSALEYLGIL